MTYRIVALCLMLCSANTVLNAQPQLQNKQSSTPVPPPSQTISLRALLQLQGDQEVRLNRLYNQYAQHRAEQEIRFASRQNGRTSLSDERLRRGQSQAQQRIANVLLANRELALKVLRPIQRAQLQSYSQDPRFDLKRDRYYQLLLLPIEDLGQEPLDLQERDANLNMRPSYRSNRSGRSEAVGSYGVYGGYSYGGPAYGVYGTVGRGSVGVHAGIGNGGPSIGIGIGRVFGGLGF